MAIKKYRAKVTGTHALTGISLEQGKEYDIEETLAGSEIFVAVGDSPGREEINTDTVIPASASASGILSEEGFRTSRNDKKKDKQEGK